MRDGGILTEGGHHHDQRTIEASTDAATGTSIRANQRCEGLPAHPSPLDVGTGQQRG